MKFKFTYIYLILGLITVGMIAYFVVAKDIDKSKTAQMPDDEIHRNLKQDPRGMNVDKEILAKIDSLKEVVSKNPKDTIALNHLGYFLLQVHKFDEAENYFEKLLEIKPDRPDVLNVLAEMNFNLQKYDKSEQYIKRILKYEKDNEIAKYNLAVVYVMQGKKDDAKKIWTEIVKKNPNSEIGKMAEESLKGLQ